MTPATSSSTASRSTRSAPGRCSTTTASASGWGRGTETGPAKRSPGRAWSSCNGSSACSKTEEPVEEGALTLHELAPRHVQRPPGGAVDLRELGRLAAPRRPLHGERAGHHRGGLEVGLGGPDGQPLAARLPELPQRLQVSQLDGQREAELLGELPGRGRDRVLGVVVPTLRDRPGRPLLAGPERAAHLTEQHFDALAGAA